jgi:hypothetical protein
MNTRLQEGLILGIFRRSFAVLAMAALALGAPAVGRAQAPSADAKSAPQASAPAAQKTAPKPSAGNGMNTGIKVHGHWTINILAKDGKLVSHHEFENSIAYGAPILSNLLAGTATPGGLAIVLGGTICPGIAALTFSTIFPATCPIVVAGSAMAAANLSSRVYYLYQQVAPSSGNTYIDMLACWETAPLCSPTLTVSSALGTSSSPAAPTLTLSGTYIAPSGGSISAVAVTGYSCAPTATIATCQNPPAQGDQVPIQTYYVQTPTWQLSGTTLGITSTPISTPISVSGGQTIQATVTISFQ